MFENLSPRDARPLALLKRVVLVVLTRELLTHFRNGAATLRATATDRPQWTRLPPPTVREAAVEIRLE